MINKPKNTASVTNEKLGSASVTWDDADFTWDEAAGSWDNPYKFNNEAKNTATPTNQAKS